MNFMLYDNASAKNNLFIVLVVVLILIALGILAYVVALYVHIHVKKNECKIVRKKTTVTLFTEGKFWLNPFNDKVLKSYKLKGNTTTRNVTYFQENLSDALLKVDVTLLYDVKDPLKFYEFEKVNKEKFLFELDSNIQNILNQVSFNDLHTDATKELIVKELNGIYQEKGVEITNSLVH